MSSISACHSPSIQDMHFYVTNNKSLAKQKHATRKTYTCDGLLKYPLEATCQAETTPKRIGLCDPSQAVKRRMHSSELVTAHLWDLLKVRMHFHPNRQIRWAFISWK